MTGQVDCDSGKPVVGFWIKSNVESAWASWTYAKGDNADYWLTLPKQPASYQMSVGCGGTSAKWAVATYTPPVTGGHNSFHCDDIPGDAGYGKCVLR